MSKLPQLAKILFAYKELQQQMSRVMEEFPGNEKQATQFIGEQQRKTLDFIDQEFSEGERKTLSDFEEMIQDDLSRLPSRIKEGIARFSMLLSATVTIAPDKTHGFVNMMIEQIDELDDDISSFGLFSNHPDFKPWSDLDGE